MNITEIKNNNNIKMLAVLSPWIFCITYGLFGLLLRGILPLDASVKSLFTLALPFIITGYRTIVTVVMVCLFVVAAVVINWRYRAWVWTMVGWAYIWLVFYSAEFIAGV